jgi:hypothetical protein
MMKIKIWVLATVNADELSPAMPKVYGTEAEAKAGFDEAMRGEWTANAPEDDDGNPLPYPGDPRTAHDELANMGRGDSWGTWELTWHTVDVPLPASMQQALAVLSSVGEQTVEDLESGIEDGTYDDVEANTARVAEINAALQTVATEGAAMPEPVRIIIEVDEDGFSSVENLPAGFVIEERRFPSYETFKDEYRHLTDDQKRAEGLHTADDGETWYFVSMHGVAADLNRAALDKADEERREMDAEVRG